MFNHQKEGKQATPNDSLEEQIVSSTFPKSEREWWAHHEINRLRAEVASLKDALIDCGHDLEKAQKANASLKEERDKWKKDFMAQNGDLAESIAALRWTEQQLAAAKEYAERLRDGYSDLLWAATERDKKNRIRQFDDFVDAAKAALALPKPWDAIRKSEG